MPCAAALLLLGGAKPALAIPSPDLAINFFSNAAQILGLATLVLGGAVMGRRKAGAAPGQGSVGVPSRRLRWIFITLAVLFAVSLIGNVLQWTRAIDDRNYRLEANLVRPSVEAGQRVGDVSLKTLSYSEQIDHPLGITTDQLAQALSAEGTEDGNFIDVREPEEQEVGWLAGFQHIRYPDVIGLRDELTLGQKPLTLICESGNRSSELCEKLAALGINCNFVVGGYGKWRTEGRPVLYPESQGSTAKRDVPDYPGKEVLLDTPDVKGLVVDEGAIFVDVRYPMDFARGHLPGAINIPLRKLKTEEMSSRLKSVPQRPVIAPCYDKRSCFYGKILGLRLHRLGYDFRGRYSVPHEYFVPATPKPYEAGLLGAQDEGLIATLSTPLEWLLLWVKDQVGLLWAGILLTVLLLRVLILPLTVKAERDQFLLQRMADRIADIKERFKDDPTQVSRELRVLYRDQRLTPGLNLLGICIQIPLFLMFFFVVDQVSVADGGSLLWVPNLGAPDPLYVLPAALGVIIYLHLHLSALRHKPLFVALRLMAAGGLTAITLNLGAGVNFYLVLSVAMMMGQGLVLRRILSRPAKGAARGVRPRRRVSDIVPLAEADSIPGCGNKAIRLARMIRAGLPVPAGQVIADGALADEPGKRLYQDKARLDALWRKLDAERVAVRSSGLGEDGEDRSYAGVFESLLNVHRDELPAALLEVRDSMASERALAYDDTEAHRGGVVVQKMVDADYAGVLFTEHPGESGCMLVEMVSGLGNAVADGTAAPDGYRCGRYSGRVLDEAVPPIDLAPLLSLGHAAEALFGAPQDIEWAYRDGRFYLLQSRTITVTSRATETERAALEAERQRLLEMAEGAPSDEAVFAQNELSELLPRPTPFSLSFMEALFAPGGSTDLACRTLGLAYDVTADSPPFVTTVFGNLYVNRAEERRRMGRGAGPMAAFKLSRMAERLEAELHEDFLPRFLSEVRLLDAIDVSRLTTDELFELLEKSCKSFIRDHYVQADIINIAADFYMKVAERELTRRGLSASTYLGDVPETVVHHAMTVLNEVKAGRRPVEDFLEVFGHRAPSDYELAQPRYAEDSVALEKLLRGAGQGPVVGAKLESAPARPENPALALSIDRACRFQALKEEAKHQCLRELAVIRRILVALDKRLSLAGTIFCLTLDEVGRLRDPAFAEQARERIVARRSEEKAFRELPLLPSELSVAELEALDLGDPKNLLAAKDGDVHGTLVAGEAPVMGRARVVCNGEIYQLQEGEILVARYLHPDWTPAFPKAAGVVTEVGGWLSHAAILAREYHVPTIVGARGAMSQIATGDVLRLNPDGSVEAVADEDGSLDGGGLGGKVVAVAGPA